MSIGKVRDYLKRNSNQHYPRTTEDTESLGSRLLTEDHSFGMWGYGFGYDVVVFTLRGHQLFFNEGHMKISQMLALADAASRPGRDIPVGTFAVGIDFTEDDLCIMTRSPVLCGPVGFGESSMAISWSAYRPRMIADKYHDHLLALATGARP